MDGFNIIQNFFTRMRCNFCSSHLQPDGIHLIRHDHDVYVVNIECLDCTRQMGIALVGLEGAEANLHDHFEDPELTEAELERLAQFSPIDYDDVVDAHRFFNQLEADWHKHLPVEMQQWEPVPEPESETDEAHP